MTSIATSTSAALLEEYESRIVIRCAIDVSKRAKIVFSVSHRSIALFSMGGGHSCEKAADAAVTVIAILSLPQPVDPNLTVAEISDGEMVIKLTKAEGVRSCVKQEPQLNR